MKSSQQDSSFILYKGVNQTDIERLNLAVPNHEIPNIRHRPAHEDMIVNSDALGPHGTAVFGGLLGVVFQSDGRRFGILDGRIRLIALMRPVWWDQGWGCICPFYFLRLRRVAIGAVMVSGGFRALHPSGFGYIERNRMSGLAFVGDVWLL